MEETARARGPGVGGPLKGSGGAAEVPGHVGTECELILCGHQQGLGSSLSEKERRWFILTEECPSLAVVGNTECRLDSESHGSVRGSCRPRGEGGLGEDGLSR